jgi:hypothetical protein
MQTKLQNWVANNLITSGYSLSYDVLNIPDLDRLIELAQEAKEELKSLPEDAILCSVWTDADFDVLLEEEEGVDKHFGL